jgi:hypothetical protein
MDVHVADSRLAYITIHQISVVNTYIKGGVAAEVDGPG